MTINHMPLDHKKELPIDLQVYAPEYASWLMEKPLDNTSTNLMQTSGQSSPVEPKEGHPFDTKLVQYS
jgi:hypothetical protein